tara:strand:- start:34674 stop:35147 length:474 start_codon:yes stop_codon:yes gene_type:complete
MNIGLDFHDTISYEPEYFCELIKSWPGEVFIVTGTPPSKIHEIEKSLEDLGLSRSNFKDILMGYEYNKNDMSLDHFKQMAKHKLKLLQDNNISVYYDDNPFYVNYIKDHGILTLQPIISKKYLQEFERSDPFFTCNLQKMQFDYLQDLGDTEMLKEK